MASPSTTPDPAPWPRYRPPHRRLADERIRAEGAELPVVLDHPMVPGNTPALVDTAEGLAALLRRLRDAGRFAYDAEFIGEQTFHPRFCLIQVATEQAVTLIDPLADFDLTPFWAMIGDASVQKIVHAGKQDLEPALRLTGRPAQKVFDTQVAAAFVGLDYPTSLEKLVAALCHADLGTDHKFSRWDRRPLTETQVAYAANDVRYLMLARHELEKRLEQFGHRDKAHAEFAELTRPEALRNDPLAMKLRARGVGKLRRRQQAVCDALRIWRYEQAEKNDVPVRAFLDDQALVDLARCKPEDAETVRNCKGVPWPIKERFAEAIVAVTQDALSGELPPRRDSGRPMTEGAKERLDTLWPAVRNHAEQRGIAPTMVLSKRELTELVRADDEGRDRPDNRLTRGWRCDFLRPVLGGLLG